MADVLGGGAAQIGDRQIIEVLFLPQHAHAAVIKVEEVLQLAEAIGGAHGIDVGVGQRHLIAPRERQHHLGLEAALDMDVQLRLREPRDEATEIVHGGNLIDGRAFAERDSHMEE